MTSFSERERGFEAKFAHDAELQFRVMARRDRLLGLWAAEKRGLPQGEAEEYARSVVKEDFQHPGDEDVVHKVADDVAALGLTEHDVRQALAHCLAEARRQIIEAL